MKKQTFFNCTGKNHRYIYFIIAGCIIGSFFGSIVNGAETTTLISDFDGVASGLDDFTEGFFDANSIGSANDFETSTSNYLSSPNSLAIKTASANVGSGWLNLTDDFSYIKTINFSFYGSFGTNFFIEFYDGSNMVLKILITSAEQIYWYDTADSHLVYAFTVNTRYYLLIEHNGTNMFNVKVLSSAFAVLDNYDNSGSYSGDYETFDDIKIYYVGETSSAVYLDNFYITTDTSEAEEEYGDISGYDSVCSGGMDMYNAPSTLIIHRNIFGWETSREYIYPEYIEFEYYYPTNAEIYVVDLAVGVDQYTQVSSTKEDYHCYVNGIPLGSADYFFSYGSGYVLRWQEASPIIITNEQVLLSFRSEQYVTYSGHNIYWYSVGLNYNSLGTTKIHNSNAQYINAVLDGYDVNGEISLCYYYDSNASNQVDEEIPESDLTDFKNQFGNPSMNYSMIEWRKTWEPCYHRVGDFAEIMYYVVNDYLEAESPYYIYSIYKVGYNVSLYDGLIGCDGSNKSGYHTTSFVFTTTGDYYLILYNTTTYGTEKNAQIDISTVLNVCPEASEGGENPNPTIGGMDSTKVMLGLIMSFGFGIGLLIISGEPVVFLAGSGAMAFVFSQPALGTYTLLPASIGTGLIIILVLVAVVMWFFR